MTDVVMVRELGSSIPVIAAASHRWHPGSLRGGPGCHSKLDAGYLRNSLTTRVIRWLHMHGPKRLKVVVAQRVTKIWFFQWRSPATAVAPFLSTAEKHKNNKRKVKKHNNIRRTREERKALKRNNIQPQGTKGGGHSVRDPS